MLELREYRGWLTVALVHIHCTEVHIILHENQEHSSMFSCFLLPPDKIHARRDCGRIFLICFHKVGQYNLPSNKIHPIKINRSLESEKSCLVSYQMGMHNQIHWFCRDIHPRAGTEYSHTHRYQFDKTFLWNPVHIGNVRLKLYCQTRIRRGGSRLTRNYSWRFRFHNDTLNKWQWRKCKCKIYEFVSFR
jgi:hypothetical protein